MTYCCEDFKNYASFIKIVMFFCPFCGARLTVKASEADAAAIVAAPDGKMEVVK